MEGIVDFELGSAVRCVSSIAPGRSSGSNALKRLTGWLCRWHWQRRGRQCLVIENRRRELAVL
jgi:hypothetical protein